MPSFKSLSTIMLTHVGLFLAGARADDGSEIETTVHLWADQSCGTDLMNGDNRVKTFDITKDDVIKSDQDNGCKGQFLGLDGWPQDSTGQYKVYVDKSGIKEDCKLMLFHKERDDDAVDNQCKTAYVTVGSSGGCVEAPIGTDFGWGYCCGEGCTMTESGTILNPTKRQESPRDITAPKRAPVSNMLDRRDECKFEKSEEYQTWGEQMRIAVIDTCSKGEGCSEDVTITTSVANSETWGISGGITGSVGVEFIASVELALQVSIDYSKTETETNSMSWRTSATVPKGGGGYIAFEPKLICAKGKFTGDCKDWPAEKDGEACFVAKIGGHPDGVKSFVAEL